MKITTCTLLILAAAVLWHSGCSEKKAESIYEIGQFEELQNNLEHARKLYKEIIDKYPESDAAHKASARLLAIDSTKIQNPLNTNGGQHMPQPMKHDYSSFDHPDVLGFLFHPRKGLSSSDNPGVMPLTIPVDETVTIGAAMHVADKASPTILFFHGNGEIVSDYDDMGDVYTKQGINFLAVDYRGYGRSTGSPTVTTMMSDAHAIFKYVVNRLKTEKFTGPIFVMGRSLGSASALELAASYPDELNGLIIESGFAYAIPLLNLLGVNTSRLNLHEEKGFSHIDKIRRFHKPTLIIHAEFDHIIPFSDGKALFDASPSPEKKFLEIPGADHNTIYAYGLSACMKAVKEMVSTAK